MSCQAVDALNVLALSQPDFVACLFQLQLPLPALDDQLLLDLIQHAGATRRLRGETAVRNASTTAASTGREVML